MSKLLSQLTAFLPRQHRLLLGVLIGLCVLSLLLSPLLGTSLRANLWQYRHATSQITALSHEADLKEEDPATWDQRLRAKEIILTTMLPDDQDRSGVLRLLERFSKKHNLVIKNIKLYDALPDYLPLELEAHGNLDNLERFMDEIGRAGRQDPYRMLVIESMELDRLEDTAVFLPPPPTPTDDEETEEVETPPVVVSILPEYDIKLTIRAPYGI